MTSKQTNAQANKEQAGKKRQTGNRRRIGREDPTSTSTNRALSSGASRQRRGEFGFPIYQVPEILSRVSHFPSSFFSSLLYAGPHRRRQPCYRGSHGSIMYLRGGDGCYLLSTALDFPEEERMMQQSSVSISLSFWEPRYQSSRRLCASPSYLQKTNSSSQPTQ